MTLKLCAALVTLLAGTGWAQPRTAQPPPQPIVVSGCVERPQKNGSIGGTGVGSSATSPNTADDDANSGQLVDAFILTGARRSGDERGELETFALEGHESEIRGHTGHRVEITGTPAPPKASSANTSGVPRLVVASVRLLAASCPAR